VRSFGATIGHMSELVIRGATADDAEICARIMWEAFDTFASFPIEPGSPEFTDFQMRAMLFSCRPATPR
jgi:hypothetical protein